jgi:hypothetical protein
MDEKRERKTEDFENKFAGYYTKYERILILL